MIAFSRFREPIRVTCWSAWIWVVVMAPCVVVHGGQIFWGSDRLAVNVRSGGEALDGTFRFELGVFEEGFEPTVENASDWRGHWVAVQRVEYDSGLRFFAGVCGIGHELLPLNAGEQGYIWGFDDEVASAGAEWLLATDPGWRWPASLEATALPLQWTTGTASSVVMGSVDAEPGVHMRMGAPPVPELSTNPRKWARPGLPGEGEAGSLNGGGDSDGDGLTDLEEYAMGSDPGDSSDRAVALPGIARIAGSAYLTLTFERNRILAAPYVLEASSDLEEWGSRDAIVEENDSTITVRDSVPLTPGSSRFLRLRFDFGF